MIGTRPTGGTSHGVRSIFAPCHPIRRAFERLAPVAPAVAIGTALHADAWALAAAALLGSALREIPRIYWWTRYGKLINKGTALATTVDEVTRVIDALADAQQTLPDAASGDRKAGLDFAVRNSGHGRPRS